MVLDARNLIWLDLEMTGLDTQSDAIIEIATVVTDAQLSVLAEGPVLAIRQPEKMLEGMDEWNQNTHTRSGLLARVRASEISEAEAERRTLDFLRQWVPPGVSPMCGNSICQDRRFLYRCMPELEQFFHYRNLDVSTLKELVKRWAPGVYDRVQKDGQHSALQDVHDSIRELQLYRDHFLRFDSDSG